MKIKVLPNGVGLPLPEFKTPQAAGVDLPSAVTATIFPGQVAKLPTGFAVALPANTFGMVKARSSSSLKGLNIEGIVDADYRGEVMLCVCNISIKPVSVLRGDRIAQLVLVPAPQATIVLVDELDETARGSGGFGSTGSR